MSIETGLSFQPPLSFQIEAFDAMEHPEALAGVLFAEEFDLPDAPPPRQPAPAAAEPAVTAADMRAARQHGYEDGHSAARAEQDTRSREGADAALAALTRSLEESSGAGTAVVAQACADTAATMLGLLAAALPSLCAEHGPAEAAALAGALLPLLAQQPRVAIRANPHTLPVLHAALADHLTDPPGRVRLIATDAMGEGDVAIEWQDGRATRSTRALCRALDDLFAPLGLTPGHVASSHAAPRPHAVEQEPARVE